MLAADTLIDKTSLRGRAIPASGAVPRRQPRSGDTS